jgi:hypothetical protein
VKTSDVNRGIVRELFVKSGDIKKIDILELNNELSTHLRKKSMGSNQITKTMGTQINQTTKTEDPAIISASCAKLAPPMPSQLLNNQFNPVKLNLNQIFQQSNHSKMDQINQQQPLNQQPKKNTELNQVSPKNYVLF